MTPLQLQLSKTCWSTDKKNTKAEEQPLPGRERHYITLMSRLFEAKQLVCDLQYANVKRTFWHFENKIVQGATRREMAAVLNQSTSWLTNLNLYRYITQPEFKEEEEIISTLRRHKGQRFLKSTPPRSAKNPESWLKAVNRVLHILFSLLLLNYFKAALLDKNVFKKWMKTFEGNLLKSNKISP